MVVKLVALIKYRVFVMYSTSRTKRSSEYDNEYLVFTIEVGPHITRLLITNNSYFFYVSKNCLQICSYVRDQHNWVKRTRKIKNFVFADELKPSD